MTIDELQQKFNEMRGKKWRVAGRNERVEICGFRVDRSGRGLITVQIETAPYAVYIDADSLSTVAGVGQVPFIEEVSPYADWPMDAKAWFWDEWRPKWPAHFAGVSEDGKPMSWANGCTSWSLGFNRLAQREWDHAELAEDGE